MKKKSQSSFEFLIIFGIGFSLIILLSGIFFSYSSSAQKGLDKKQINNFGEELMSNINRIYFLGSGNRITMKTNFPDGIENFTIEHLNISDPNNVGQFLQFDRLNISFYYEKILVSNIYETNQLYIRFNCTQCYQIISTNGNWISYYNDSDFTQGTKNIRIENLGNYVSIDFFKG